MLTSLIVRVIAFCTRHAWQTVAIGVLLAVASGLYAASHFAINSDINALLSPKLDWRKRELAFEEAFGRYKVIEGQPAPPSELRGFIEVRPILNYGAIEAGRAASEAIRQAAADIAPRFQARVRLTGPVAMADEEFATIKENAVRNGLITLGI